MTEAELEKAERFQELYRSLLTPVGLIVTVSGVFYVNLGSFFKKESALVAYQLLVGVAVLSLLTSVFLYGFAYMDAKRYRRHLSQGAFFFMMSAAFWSSLLLVVPLLSTWIPGETREPVVSAVMVAYVSIGLVVTILFCRSKL